MPRLTPVHWRKLTKVFEKAGWKHARTKGDHLVYAKKGFVRPVVIPKYREIPKFIIQKNLQTAKLTRKDYFNLLKSVKKR